MRLGLTNRIVDDSDSKPVDIDHWFRSDSKSNDGFESAIAILIKQIVFDLFWLKDWFRDKKSQLNYQKVD